MKKEYYQIKDLKIALKDFELIVTSSDKKDRLWLVNGNNSEKKLDAIPVEDGRIFKMRYREAWGNWLLCAVLEHIHGTKFSFQDNDGDGIIFNRTTKQGWTMEHVSAMDFKDGPKLPKGEDRVLWAINNKIKKGKKNPGYAQGKNLVVFLDGADKWYPNKVARKIHGTHAFPAIYCIGLINANENGYNYAVTAFYKEGCPIFRVEINKDFTDWKVIQIQ